MYAGMDVICTSLIYESLMGKLKKSHASGIHSAELLRTDHEDMLNCALMGARGMKVNRAYFEGLGQRYDEIYLKRKAEANDRFGLTALGSTKQLAAIFEAEGHPVAKVTKQGNPKVDVIELRRQADLGSELAEIVIEGKKMQKWSSTFVTGILEASTAADRIHPKFDPLGARTARYSSSEPNMQNLPGKVDDIRMGMEVDYPELETGVSLDYQSQELRLLAATSQDPQLCEDLMAGKKPVKILAVRIYGPGADEDELKYGRTKNTVYASLYGAGARKLAETAGISVDESKAVLNELYEMYPETKVYSDYLMGVAARQGYIKNLAGRLIIVDPNKPYTALNYMLQSTGRELIAAAIRDIMKSRWNPILRLVVHDEIVTVCPNNLVQQMIPEVSAMMNTDINGMEFPAGAEIWGQKWQGHKS
jgi:DNA polymerase-1